MQKHVFKSIEIEFLIKSDECQILNYTTTHHFTWHYSNMSLSLLNLIPNAAISAVIVNWIKPCKVVSGNIV